MPNELVHNLLKGQATLNTDRTINLYSADYLNFNNTFAGIHQLSAMV